MTLKIFLIETYYLFTNNPAKLKIYRCRMQYGLLCNMDYSIETKEIPIIVYC